MEKIFQIADNVHGSVKCSKIEREIISTSAFNRLHYILQNSTAYKTFPANRTTRFMHSIGVMHISGQMFYHSFLNSNVRVKQKLLKSVKEEIENFIKSQPSIFRSVSSGNIEKFSKKFESEDFYKYYLTNELNEVEIFCYLVVFQSIRVAALLHDVGHPPYSHIVEYALMDLYSEIADKPIGSINEKEKVFKETLDGYTDKFREKIVIHEAIGIEISTRILEEASKTFDSKLGKKEVDKIYKSFVMLVTEFAKKILGTRSISDTFKEQLDDITPIYSFLHEYIAGNIDSDRLDYIVRDPYNSGVNKGILEYDRLFLSMRINEYDYSKHGIGSKDFMFSFDFRAKNTIEVFFRNRWEMYRDIIYHHSVRKSDSIVNQFVYKLLKNSMEKHIKGSGSDSADDSMRLIENIDGLWQAVRISFDNDDYFETLIQWNDNWLLATVFNSLYNKETDVESDSFTDKLLKDFVENNKSFKSIIKRQTDFEEINAELLKLLSVNEELDEILTLIIENETHKKDATKFYRAVKKGEKISFLGLHLNSFMKSFEPILRDYNYTFPTLIKKAINCSFTDMNIDEYLFTYNKAKNDDFFVLLHDGDKIEELKKYSKLYEELKLAESTFPDFYVSVYSGDGEELDIQKKKDIIRSISECIAEEIMNVLRVLKGNLITE